MKIQKSPDPEPILVVYSAETKIAVISTVDLRQSRVDEFLASRSLQPKSRKAYQADLRTFMDWCDLASVDVSRRKVTQFITFLLKERELALSSVNRVLRTLKSFYRWMLLSEYVVADPTIGIQQERLPDPVAKDLEDEEVLQIYEAIALSKMMLRDRSLFSILLHGLRAEEVCRLNVEDYVNGELVIKEAKLVIQDLDAYLVWRRDQEGELLPDIAIRHEL
jgi:site-specific recombinase XerD